MTKRTALHIMIGLLVPVIVMSCKTGEVDLSSCRPLVTENDNGKEISVKKGETVCVKLLARLGTGFGWQVEKSPALVKQLGKPLQFQEKKGEPGSAEFQVFQFTAQDAGKGDLELVYRRPWMKNVPPEKSFKVTLTVQ